MDQFGFNDNLGLGPPARVIVDWKTATTLPDEPWDDHAAQLAGYALAGYYLDTDAMRHPMGHIDYGMVVYISVDKCKAFVIDGQAWEVAKDRWRAAWAFFGALYPSLVPA